MVTRLNFKGVMYESLGQGTMLDMHKLLHYLPVLIVWLS